MLLGRGGAVDSGTASPLAGPVPARMLGGCHLPKPREKSEGDHPTCVPRPWPKGDYAPIWPGPNSLWLFGAAFVRGDDL